MLIIRGLSDIHVTYTINVKYPDVVAPEKTKLNWVDDSYFIAHGRYDNFDTPTTYEMVAVLNDEFDLINYNPYKGQTHDKDWARATLSFELVDQHNNASKIADGHNSGVSVCIKVKTTSGISLWRQQTKDVLGSMLLTLRI